MSTLIPMLDDGSQRWLATMVAVLLQSALLAAAAFLIVRALRRSSPAVRYWLWQIVAVKLLLMPFWTFALPLPSWATGWPTSRPAAISPVGGRVGDASAATSELDGATAGVNQKAVSPPATPENPPTPISWPSWLLMVWSAVGLSLLVRLMFQRMRLARLLRRGVPVSRDIAELVAELAGRMGLRRAPAAVSVADDCPLFVCGFRRPRIVVPRRLLAALSLPERRQALLHELAHLKRWDLIWGWPVEIAKIVYFFNPLVYGVAAQLRLERELACDQMAMAHSGHSPSDYAQTLIQAVRRVADNEALAP